jgi:transmembrane sensor
MKKYFMHNNITKEVLDNFIKGKYTHNQYLQVKEWFYDIHNYEEVKENIYDYWKEINNLKEVDEESFEHIYENIEYHILLEEHNHAKKRKLWDAYRQVAAILLIPILVFSIYYYLIGESSRPVESGWVEINSPDGARTEFMLPDGSKGWLNSGSILRYIPPFNKSRVVELNGEAFFDVVSKKSVFTVSIEDLNISVYGTEFNVAAYSGENQSEVVLESGIVMVKGKRCNLEKELMPDQKLTYIPANHKYILQQVDAEIYTSWKEGFLMMDNETFEEASRRMEKWYNIEIKIEDETLKKYRFKATFQDEPVEEVFRLIALTTPIEYEIRKRVPGENGVYRKKEIYLRMKK